jgi:1,2-diacylglycerol 3-alpha-glucosyltransferase
MNILMVTNTYRPIVGGLERSIEVFSQEYRKRGHRVKIIAPTFENMPPREKDVVRVPAIHHFRKSDFSIELPIPSIAEKSLNGFYPDIVHSHHPFFLGDTAFRIAVELKSPLIFTHHCLYEKNTHYAPAGDSPAMKKFVVELATGYANLCEHVFAPSESLAHLLKERGVHTPMDVVPTGIYIKELAGGDGEAVRGKCSIAPGSFVVGSVSRLVPEKNVLFLTRAVSDFLRTEKSAYFVVAGKGQNENEMRDYFEKQGVAERVRFLGLLNRDELADFYAAMDVFAFASTTETQGLVIIEAFAARVPVVAIDSWGVRDVVKDGVNGILLPREDVREFTRALRRFKDIPLQGKERMRDEAERTASAFNMD